jgi:FkbM family methyltransferase
MHERFLWEAELYPNNIYSALFDDVFPVDRNRSDVCAIGVEANMVHAPRLRALQKYYANRGLNAHYVFGAASDREQTLTFYHQDDVAKNEWGFTTGVSADFTTQNPETIKAFSLPTFIELQVMKRMIPEKLLPDDKPAAVIMKMDIEGAEYEVLPALLASGAWCAIHTITCEFHPRSVPTIDYAAREYIKESVFNTTAFFQKHVCPTVFSSLDSEQYYNDTTAGIALLRASSHYKSSRHGNYLR